MAYQNDRKYLSRRMDEDLGHGDRAANSSVAAIHYELAYRYALKCSEEPSEPPALKLVPGGRPPAPNAEFDPPSDVASYRERRPLEGIKAQA